MDEKSIVLSGNDVRLIVLALRDITTAMSVDDESQRKSFVNNAIISIRELTESACSCFFKIPSMIDEQDPSFENAVGVVEEQC